MKTQSVRFTFRGLLLDAEIYTWPESRGARERGTGLQLEPDEPAGFEVEKVTLIENEDDLTEEDVAEVLADEDGIYQSIIDELDAYWEDER